ncbi:MAG: hypothetical protein KDA21_15420 [Phycisphaerales bacterium]|nr:hypothetical protein [Phycisphaerales bacterium]
MKPTDPGSPDKPAAPPQSDITLLLDEVERAAPEAPERLLEAVYEELRTLAAARLARERRDHTLQPTALVNEVYLRLVGNQAHLNNRAYFFAAAARAMERVLIDHARQRAALKRGGAAVRVTLLDVSAAESADDLDIFELREAIVKLEAESAELALLVRYRYFLGLSLQETSLLMDLPLATLKRRWAFARAWLYTEVSGSEAQDIDGGGG